MKVLILYKKQSNLPCARLDNNNIVRYGLNIEPYDIVNDAGCIMFWFKMDDFSQTYSALCGITPNSINSNTKLNAYIANKKVIVDIRDERKTTKTLFVSNYEVREGWNFFALNFRNYNDGISGDEFNCDMILNDHTQNYKSGDIKMRFANELIYCISTDTITDGGYLRGYVAGLVITPRKRLESDLMQSYYRSFKDIIADNRFVDKTEKTVDFGQSSVYTVNSNIQSKFEIYPLRNNLLSLTGKKPVKFDLRNVLACDSDKVFNFNQAIKGYAYVADGEMLQYDFGQSTSGTVMMRAYSDISFGSQYLFDCVDDGGKHIGLYLDSDGFLSIECNGDIISTSLRFKAKQWNTLGLSFAAENAVYGNGGVLSLRVYLNGKEYNEQTDLVSFGALKVTIGRRSTSSKSALNGQIEMLAANTAFNELSTIQTLANELSVLSKSNEYDEFGLLKKTDVHKDGNSVLSHTYEYKSVVEDEISEQVSCEVIKYGDTENRRQYETDALGRIISISDNVFGNNNYTYNYRGFLTAANSESFEYDKNGNITKYNGTVFGYDSVIKDKLISVGGTAVNYANAASLNPTSWGTKIYGYEGRRLTSFKDNKRTGYSYEYDEQCHRTRKVVTGYGATTYNYTYSGDNLVIEDGPNGKLFFLYDENGQLYGFVKDEKKYFYIKDVTGTILGIVDESGTLVAKYKYSAFGKCEIVLSVNSIATINPFRFKCYYYDSESGMYYCQTRYFVPEWGRWLNADNPGFLQFDNINGMNLFAYCVNNPIMFLDENGTLPNWAKWLIGAVAFIGAALLTAATGGSAAPLVYGMISSIAIEGLLGGIVEVSNGGSFYDGFVDGASDGAMWGGIFAFGGAVFRLVKIAKQGITIGKAFTYKEIARMTNTYYYRGLKSHSFLVEHFGREFADKVGWMQNKFLIRCVQFFGGAIYDAGGELTGAYAKEKLLTQGYKYLYNIWLF